MWMKGKVNNVNRKVNVVDMKVVVDVVVSHHGLPNFLD